MNTFRRHKVVFYCPDTHVVTDGRTPYTVGIGGGISTRIRVARALNRLGNEVLMVANCERSEIIDGVEYIPLLDCDGIKGDVLIATTSGGELDLMPLLDIDVQTSINIVWVHGITKPKGLNEIPYNSVYCVSNFIGNVVRSEWGIPGNRVFVSYNGYEQEIFSRAEKFSPIRDPFRMIYFSHPSKGLDTAIEVLKILRSYNSKYHLVVFGGRALWGEEDSTEPSIEGVSFRGMIGQEALAVELLKSTFAIQMQDREEPGALAIVDARRAGCIIIGSPVGCYPEMVEDRESGFLFAGDHHSGEVRAQAASAIMDLGRRPDELKHVQEKARNVKWSSERQVRTWLGHWNWLEELVNTEQRKSPCMQTKCCEICGGLLLYLADGLHCAVCGHYSSIDGI